MIKEWKYIGDRNQYRISNYGKVESRLKGGRKPILTDSWKSLKSAKGRTDNHGGYYHSVRICLEQGSPTSHRIHRLVIKHFIGDCPIGKEVNHIDGNRDNNRLDNLEYITKKENIQNAVKRGSFDGKRAFCGKLSIEMCKEMEMMINNRVHINDVAKKFNIHPTTVSHFVRGVFYYKPNINSELIKRRRPKGYKNL